MTKIYSLILMSVILFLCKEQVYEEEGKNIFNQYLSQYKIVYDSHEEYLKNLGLFLNSYKNPEFNVKIFLNLKNKSKRNLSGYATSLKRHLEKISLPDYYEIKSVNYVQDQGNCGACAVFSMISAFEQYYKSKFHSSEKFSEQAVIDCFILDGDICKKGSSYEYIYEFIEKYNPMLASDYPYISYNYSTITQFCKFNFSKTVDITHPLLYTISQNKTTGYVDALSIAYYLYNYGPIITSLNAYCEPFYSNYHNENNLIRDDISCNKTDLNHAVIIYGWGISTTGVLYWIVKNSWGELWGNKGYAYITAGRNSFGIETSLHFLHDIISDEDSNTTKVENEDKYVCNGLYLVPNNISFIFIMILIYLAIN